MVKFDEYEFKRWLDEKIGFPIRKFNAGQRFPDPKSLVDERVQEAIEDLTALELVCYLGDFLAEKNND